MRASCPAPAMPTSTGRWAGLRGVRAGGEGLGHGHPATLRGCSDSSQTRTSRTREPHVRPGAADRVWLAMLRWTCHPRSLLQPPPCAGVRLRRRVPLQPSRARIPAGRAACCRSRTSVRTTTTCGSSAPTAPCGPRPAGAAPAPRRRSAPPWRAAATRTYCTVADHPTRGMTGTLQVVRAASGPRHAPPRECRATIERARRSTGSCGAPASAAAPGRGRRGWRRTARVRRRGAPDAPRSILRGPAARIDGAPLDPVNPTGTTCCGGSTAPCAPSTRWSSG